MDNSSLKENMKSLWKETFRDSSEYVDLIFDNYFNPDRVAFVEENGEVKSALLGVPYTFLSGSGTKLKGMYLCGLATKKESRRKGMMTGLLEQMNRKAKDSGFDFTFLIPAGEGVRRYYRDRGYHDAFFLKNEYYVRGHDFKSTVEISLTQPDGRLDDFLNTIGNRPYAKPNAFNMLHSENDWRAVLKEAVISNLPVFAGEYDGKICAVGFMEKMEREVRIKKLIASEPRFENAFLKRISEEFPEHNITLVKDLESVVENGAESQLWAPFYAQSNGARAEYEDVAVVEQPFNETLNSYSLGMVNIFDIKELLIKTGYDKIEELSNYTEDEVRKLVLRKPVGDKADALEKILDLPEISLSMALLLE